MMSLPDYQSLMLPLLKLLDDGQIHTTQEAVDHLSRVMNLTEEQLNDWLPSKKQKTFTNRVHWAKAYLKMCSAVENISKGKFVITERGRQILAAKPESITVKYLINL